MRNYSGEPAHVTIFRVQRFSLAFFATRRDKLHQLGRKRTGRVQGAFSLAESCPAPRTWVLARLDGTSAMSATNAGEILIVQWIVRHIVLEDMFPDHLSGPVRQRADLHQIEFGVPIHFTYTSPFGSLVAADGSHPCIERRQLAPQRLDFAQAAARVWIAAPQRRPESSLLLFRRQFRVKFLDLDSIALFHAINQIICLWEEKLGIAGKNF